MTAERRPQPREIPIFGVILLFVGIVLLLQTLGVVPWGLWGTLWRIWPLLLIIIGLVLVLRRFNPWLVSLLILALLFAGFGFALWRYQPAASTGTTRSYSQPLDNLGRANVNLDFSAGTLSIDSLPSTSPNFVEVDSRGSDVRADFRREGNTGTLDLDSVRGSGGIEWEVGFNTRVSMTLNIDSAAGGLDVKLVRLRIPELTVEISAGSCELAMPSPTGTVTASVQTNVSSVEITIPSGVAVRIRGKVNLGALSLDEGRFPRKDDYWASPDFDTAKDRIDLEVNTNLGRVTVR